jgi:predicted dehydrogenase
MTEKKPQRVAVVGCGFFAQNHIHAWKMLEGAELVAVCDTQRERARAAAELAGGASAHTDISEMLRSAAPDVVDVVTSPPSHRMLAEICAAHRTNAIIQKPLAMSFGDAIAIVDAAKAAGVTMMAHENFRFQLPIREVKNILASGVIGELRYCSIAYRTSYKVFPRDPSLQDGDRLILMDMGVHVFDVARFLMGEIADVSCRLTRTHAGDDMASAVVAFADGGIGTVEVSSASLLPGNTGIDTLISVEGRNGSVILGRGGAIAVRSGDDVTTLTVAPPPPPWGSARWAGVQHSVIGTCRHWLDAMAGRVPMEVSVQDNLKTLAVVEACYRSAAQAGTSVTPADVLAGARAQQPERAYG